MIEDESHIDPEIEEQPQEAEDMSDECWIEKWAYDDYERQCMGY